METTHTSLELSKWLQENGCEIEGRMYWRSPAPAHGYNEWTLSGYNSHCTENIPAYDILNDICVKHAKEFFGDSKTCFCDACYLSNLTHTQHIFCLISRGKKQEAEDYIKEHCLFNPKNK